MTSTIGPDSARCPTTPVPGDAPVAPAPHVVVLQPSARALGGVELISTELVARLAARGIDAQRVSLEAAVAASRLARMLCRCRLPELALAVAVRSVVRRIPAATVVIASGYMLGLTRRARTITFLHGTAIGYHRAIRRPGGPRLGDLRAALAAVLEWQSTRGRVVACVTAQVRAQMERYYGAPAHAVVIHNPTPGPAADILPARPDRCTFLLFAGRPEHGKGWSTFVRLVQQAAPRPCVAFVPSPPNDGRLLPTNLTLRVGEGRDAVVAALAHSAALVLPTRYEGCELVTLEAAAHGTPVVGTNVGARHLLRQECLWLARLDLPADTPPNAVLDRVIAAVEQIAEDERADIRTTAAHLFAVDVFAERWDALVRRTAADHGTWHGGWR